MKEKEERLQGKSRHGGFRANAVSGLAGKEAIHGNCRSWSLVRERRFLISSGTIADTVRSRDASRETPAKRRDEEAC